MARTKPKTYTFVVEVEVPPYVTKREAAREVKTLINDQCHYLSHKLVKYELLEVSIKATRIGFNYTFGDNNGTS